MANDSLKSTQGSSMTAPQIIEEGIRSNPDVQLVLSIAARVADLEATTPPLSLSPSTVIITAIEECPGPLEIRLR